VTHSSKALKEIQSVYLTFEESSEVNVSAFEQFMGELLWESGQTVMRCKGKLTGRAADGTLHDYML